MRACSFEQVCIGGATEEAKKTAEAILWVLGGKQTPFTGDDTYHI